MVFISQVTMRQGRKRGLTLPRKGEKLKEISNVEIKDKLNLTPEEAAKYSNIGINKIEEMLRKPNCPFVLYIGKKKLVKRIPFEDYLKKVIEL